jgi:hypothetical protein
MSESFKKKVIKNKPFRNAKGQYNFDLNTNLGVYPYIDNKFLDKDLYSLNEGEEINEAVLREQQTIPIQNNSYFIIDNLTIINSGVGGYLNHVRFNANIIDEVKLGYDASTASYSTLNTFHASQLATDSRFYYANYGDENPGWGPGTIIQGATLFDNLFNNNNFSYLQPGGTLDYFNESSLENTFQSPMTAVQEGKNIYIIIRTEGDHHKYWGTDDRRHRIHVFTIPVDDIINSSEEVEYKFTYGDATVREGGGGSGGSEAPAFVVSNLDIRVFRGVAEVDQGENLSDNILPYAATLDFPNFISNDDYQGIISARPNRIIDWEKTAVNNNIDFNFYPASKVNITVGDSDIVDFQSYYTNINDRFKASSPTTVDLSFKIGRYVETGEITHYIPNDDVEKNNIKFKFFVIDWDDSDNKINGWDAVFSQWPVNMDEFINKRQNNLYKFGEISYSEAVGFWDINNLGEKVKNTYTSPGLKNIKVIIFSYINDNDGIRFQPIRWKFANIKIYLDSAKAFMEDFSDIGGADFVTLPWPNTTPVISGISGESQYVKSLSNVLSSGKLAENDILDSSLLIRARENDELGDYVGDMDFEQSRVFNKPYSMAELLMIQDEIVDGSIFYPYTDTTHWDGETNTFPMESCVGLIFINDSTNSDLRQSCILELNSQELEGDVMRDSSGNGNKGILIGDYRIDKPSKDVPIRRKTEPKISETDSENGAI